jgi:hypothetical protein
VDETAIESLVNSMDIDIKKANFKKICAELDVRIKVIEVVFRKWDCR